MWIELEQVAVELPASDHSCSHRNRLKDGIAGISGLVPGVRIGLAG